MATYYKYAERSAGSQVNWAEIGKNLTDTLNEENKLREQKKAAIDESTRQYGLRLEKSPQGDNTTLNQWGLDYAADAQQARLLQDRLLKQGKLKLRDYTMMRQNLMDGTNEAFGLLDEYNAEYKEKMERAKTMDPAAGSQYLEQWLMEQAEGFANFKESKLYINPTTFAVNVAKVKNVGGVTQMSDDPNDFTTVNDLRNRIKARFDKFDADTYLAKQVALLGTEIKTEIINGTSRKVGQKITIEDITERSGAREAISAMIDAAFAGSPTNMSSVLTNALGLYKDPTNPSAAGIPYTFTWDKSAAGKNVIYLENVDGKITPQFTSEQEKAAKDYMLQKINTMLTRKKDIDVFTEPQPASRGGSGASGDKKDISYGNLFGYLYSGNGAQIEAAVQGIEALPGVEKVTRTQSGVTIKFEDGKQKTFGFYDDAGNGKSIGDFVKSIGFGILGTDSNLDLVTQGAYNIGNPNLNQDYMSGPDLTGLDPTNWKDALEISKRVMDWQENQKYYNEQSGDQQGGGQQGGGTGELD